MSRPLLWQKLEPLLGRYGGTPFGLAFERGLRTMIKAGHDHSLAPESVAHTIWEGLAAAHPEPR